jgi:hypothetical protein
MAYTRHRRPARAYLADTYSIGDLNRSRQRLIILSTGRGDMHLSADEAKALATELKESARRTERFLARRGEESSAPVPT